MENQWNWFGDSVLSKGQETQLRIMKTALRLFSDKGYSAVTLQKIAKGAKTSHPLILKHFGDKENLLLAVRKYVSFSNHQWVDQKIKPSMNGRDCIITHCVENLNWGYHNPNEAKIILLTYYYSSMEDGGLGAFRMGTERLHRYVLQAKREGALTSGLNTETVTEMIHEYAVGIFVKMLATDPHKTKKLPSLYVKKMTMALDAFFSIKD